MPDIYKHGYDNFKKITVLFILQIILSVLPVVLLVIYIGFSLYSNVVLGYTFIVIMAIAAALNFTITKRYNVLLSGFKGEKSLMTSPIRQMRRQRDIIKSILRANDLDQWVDTVLYFSAPTVHLYLDLSDSDNVCSSEKELLEFLRTYVSPKSMDPEKLEKIKVLFKEMCVSK